MASTQKYLNHLLQCVGITPACSEEERAAAEEIAEIFANHGFEPEMQEFSASASAKIVQAVLGIVAFLAAVLLGVGGAAGIVGLLLAFAVAALFVMERTGRPVLSTVGGGGLSQNVIAYHKASGPMASPRNRPVVIVAHYDSPRADLVAQQPFSTYRPLLVKLLPYAMLAPAAIGIVRLLPLPDAAKVVLWLLAIVAALVPLANAAAIIANRFVLPYTSGAVCNKSSVAALLGVMDAVAPYQGKDEFPKDRPFEEYMAEQEEIAAAMLAAMQAAEEEMSEAEAAEGELVEEVEGEAADGDEPPFGGEVEDDAMSPDETAAMSMEEVFEETSALAGSGETQAMALDELGDDDVEEIGADQAEADEEPSLVNAAGNIRHGEDVIRGLGMLASSCRLVYEDERGEAPVAAAESESELEPAFEPEQGEGLEDEAPELVGQELKVEEDSEPLLDEAEQADEVEPSEYDEDEGYEGAEEEADEAEPELPFEDGAEATVEDDGEPALDYEFEPDEPPIDAPDATQVFEPVEEFADEDMGATQAMPAQRPVETVDSLMAEIDASVPQATIRQIPPVVPDASVFRQPAPANRASLFDIPDPAEARDPFAASTTGAFSAPPAAAPSSNGFTVLGPDDPVPAMDEPPSTPDSIPLMTAPAQAEKPKRGLARFFGRKKKKQESMSEWLGVDEDFDAKRNGSQIGSWDNFNSDDDGWKGGAAGVEGVTEDELRDAITSLGDDELLGHDIWFVATGASECGNAGINAFLNTHRDKLRGVFLINLESVGAGRVAMLATEGETRVLKGDKRIMKLVSRVSSDFHNEIGKVDMPFITTDAHAAMSMSLRSLTLAGVDGAHLACSHNEEDQPFNVDAGNVQMVADVVTEVIRRS